ncbi:MAG: MFS transporter [Bacteroidales bacterium]|nr:MFS transporter [Bacteroidales bacterium]
MKLQRLNSTDSQNNFKAFIWHGLFLALASNFMDVNMVIPSMLLKMGAGSIHLGILTAILIGGSSFMQLIFSLFLQKTAFKKPFILMGINIRIIMLFMLSLLFFAGLSFSGFWLLFSVYFLISVFALSGSFANVSYIDIIGKTIDQQTRKRFFSLKQVFNSLGVLASAMAAGWMLKSFEYPDNFSRMFLVAAVLLLVASFGFWALRENIPSGTNPISLKQFHGKIIHEWKNNQNLRYYLLIVNTLGVGVSMIPFLIMLSKNNSGLSFDKVGDFLIFQTIGMISGSLTMFFFSKKMRFKPILFFNAFLFACILVLSLILQGNQGLFSYIFILTGLFVATYKIVIDNILIEISTNENRTLYTGLAGAGNLFPMIIPVLVGFLLKYLSFTWVFSVVILLIIISLWPIYRLKCRN